MENLNESIYEKLSKLEWLMHRQQMMNQTEFGTFANQTRGQGRVLAMLKIQPEISTKDLAYLLGIRQQSLNELLNKLEKNEYIVRKPSDVDKRVMIIHLTEKGKKIEQANTRYDDIFKTFTEQELFTFEGYLDRLISALEEQVGYENEDMMDWMKGARERMGKEQFDKLMSMRKGGFGAFGRGEMPENMPGAERFSPDYDGPVPDRSEPFPFAWGNKKKNEEEK